MTVVEKKPLSMSDIDSQVTFELPARQMLSLVTIVITNLLNNLSVDVKVQNNNVAVQVCAVISALNANIGTNLTCAIGQH